MIEQIQNLSNRKIWALVFTYVVMVALLIQFIILPYVFPQLNDGNGLMAGVDTSLFHSIAVEESREIREHGWSAWELFPDGESGFSIAGIAAAVYALANSESPALFIPINAALHATAAVVLVSLITLITGNRGDAIIASIPLVFFPSNLNWIAQIHKDGFFILGTLLVLFGLVRLTGLKSWRNMRWGELSSLAGIALGFILTWFVRPYGVQLLQAFMLFLFIPIFGVLLWSARHNRVTWVFVAVTLVISMVGLIGLTVILTNPGSGSIEPGDIVANDELIEMGRDTPVGSMVWQPSPWLPNFVDQRLQTIALVRDNMLAFYGASDADSTTRMSRAEDFIAFAPQALVRSVFAPFPWTWFNRPAGSANTQVMRAIGIAEVMAIYLTLPWVLYSIWRWRRSPQLWLVVSFCLFFLMAYSITTPHVGSLHRVRYGFITTLMAIGIAGFLAFLRTRPFTARLRQKA